MGKGMRAAKKPKAGGMGNMQKSACAPRGSGTGSAYFCAGGKECAESGEKAKGCKAAPPARAY